MNEAHLLVCKPCYTRDIAELEAEIEKLKAEIETVREERDSWVLAYNNRAAREERNRHE